MQLPFHHNTPFNVQLSFDHVVNQLRNKVQQGDACLAEEAALLAEIEKVPELINGVTSFAEIEAHEPLIRRLLAGYFPEELTHNEIKAVSLPYISHTFNHTERFNKILQDAGASPDITIRDFDEHQFYVLSCCLILNEYYGTNLDFSKPIFYDIPDANGIIKHYRILYNADFLEILPTEQSVKITQEDIDLLMNNYDDMELWKARFPKGSWLLKGFAIINLVDVTVENAVSIFKESLLGLSVNNFQSIIESTFRSIYRIPDIQVGASLYNEEEQQFVAAAFKQRLKSFMLQNSDKLNTKEALCPGSCNNLIHKHTYFSIYDTAEALSRDPDNMLIAGFHAQGARSFILAPIVKNGVLLGVIEVVSLRPRELNSINANKLDIVIPFLTETLERLIVELRNKIQAIIYDKYTTIHASVYWRFRAEAQKYMLSKQAGQSYQFNDVLFEDVYPLYGQIDVKGSSDARNEALKKDLQRQLTDLSALLLKIKHHTNDDYLEVHLQQAGYFLSDLAQQPLLASTEQFIENYVETHIHPYLKQVNDAGLLPYINDYLGEADKLNGIFHFYSRRYAATIDEINNRMVHMLDDSQADAQLIFPHYFERFKTDGVEHNLYIGSSIAPNKGFEMKHLHSLRLWQLKTLCLMERAHYHSRPSLPIDLDVTTLVLVYQSPLSIRFRIDEKRFDVDGSYNARFEMVKKRIDKAFVKNAQERITQPGKITIVYSNALHEQEYLDYIEELRAQQILDSEIEIVEVEDLQGIAGLKAIRAAIRHDK
ncbi:GAF domain-containing protein [Mucilaginibacter sp. Bleaf8]|uniref:GAF domain-containing protein n=1 Tax=Mucilaginibacter sp. Bleaf8 TaxID=2834430 RepID=UPI001BCD157E|nr:GAF domain-containing protein [Mucilaginibacter sp. Bleaf8]MBS7564083.1 GAF domain-containing protein [Mucilaginibacter sp. Bleaf8]